MTIIAPENFFSSVIQQWTLDYRLMPDWDEKQEMHNFFLEKFGSIPDTTLDFIKLDGKFYYKTHRDKRIPLKLASGVKVISLDNIPFTLPW